MKGPGPHHMPVPPATAPAGGRGQEFTTTVTNSGARRKVVSRGDEASVSGRPPLGYPPSTAGSAARTSPFAHSTTGMSETGAEALMELGLGPDQHERLLADACKRVRELERLLQEEESLQAKKIEGLQQRVKKLSTENRNILNKYHAEKDSAIFYSEEGKKKDELLTQVMEENQRLRTKLLGLNKQNSEGWDQVGQKNLKLQRLRRQTMKLTKDYEKEKVARITVERERDAVALRIKPIKQKNLEMQYRLRLEVEKNAGTREKMVQVAEELQEERRYMERLATDAQNATQDMASAMEEGSRMQLQVQQLFEHNQELSKDLANEEDTRSELGKALDETQRALHQQRESNNALGRALEDEQGVRQQLQAALDDECEENGRLQAVAGELQGALEDEVNIRQHLEEHSRDMGEELRDLRMHTPLIKGVYHTSKQRSHLQLSKLRTELHALDENPGTRVLHPGDMTGRMMPTRGVSHHSWGTKSDRSWGSRTVR